MLHLIPAEKAPVLPEMAIRLDKFSGNGPNLWISMQISRDLWIAGEKLMESVEAIPDRSNGAT
jgi:plasmid maintenance system antidote protein VapI